jgi:hypothetical protein
LIKNRWQIYTIKKSDGIKGTKKARKETAPLWEAFSFLA